MRAFLDGEKLEQQQTGWTLTTGTAPHVRTFEIDEGVANKIHEAAGIETSTLTLDCTQEGLGTRTVSRLTVLGTGPTATVGTATIAVADRRWLWARKLFKRSYNVRRRTGERRRLQGGNIPKAVADIDDDVAYVAWSLKDETTAWSGAEVLEDVLNEVAGDWRREGTAGLVLPDVEGLELDGPGDVCLGQVLGYFGLALAVWVDWDGTVVLTDRLDDGERELVGAPSRAGAGGTRTRGQVPEGILGKPFQGYPLWAVQDRRRERPTKVVVHFDRALELRLDYSEDANGDAEDGEGGTTRTPDEKKGLPPRLENVLALPEDAKINGEDLVQGTWVQLSDYLDFLNSTDAGGAGGPPGDLPPLTIDILRKGYLSGILSSYASPAVDPSGVWAFRTQSVHNSYRLKFRLRKTWMDRIKQVRPYRVAILSPETGARGPATVYADHAFWSTWRWKEHKRNSDRPELAKILRNVYANATTNPGNIIGTNIEDLRAAPATVTIDDEDQGIFTLSWLLDFTGQAMRVFPSAFDSDTIPSDDPEEDNQWHQFGHLTSTHEVSVVLTVSAGAPNSLKQLHKVDVFPEAADGPADGPEFHVRVSPQRSIARFPWDDDKDQQVWDAFTPGNNADLTDALGEPINTGEIEDVAKAIGRSVYSFFRDHVEGGFTGAFQPDVGLKGTVSALSLELVPGPNGGGLTRLALPSEPPPVAWEQLLPAGTRRLINRMVDP